MRKKERIKEYSVTVTPKGRPIEVRRTNGKTTCLTAITRADYNERTGEKNIPKKYGSKDL